MCGWLLVTGEGFIAKRFGYTSATIQSSVRLFQVVKVLHQLFVVHAEVEVVEFDRVAGAGVLLFLVRGCGIEGEHRVPNDRRPFHVHRSPVTGLHEQRVGVPLRQFRAVVVANDRRRSATACSATEKYKLKKNSRIQISPGHRGHFTCHRDVYTPWLRLR